MKGYSQIPGIDYSETFSPVANDSSIRIVLSITLTNKGWEINVVDIEAAFLEAHLEEDVYIEWPEGLIEMGFTTKEIKEEYCINLGNAMYGTVQGPRSFFLTFSKILRSPPLNMQQSQQDPCLWYRKDLEGNIILIVVVYVDDYLVCGKREVIEWWKQCVKKRFSISDLGKISKHIGVWYEEGQDEHGKFLKNYHRLLL